MGKLLRIAALLCCLGVLVLGAVALNPNGPLLSSFWGCTGRKNSLVEAFEESQRIAPIKEASFRRLDTKKQIAEEVIARQRSLVEAMEQFRALDQEWPEVGSAVKKAQEDRGISEDEWYGRNVLFFVQVVLLDRPDEAAAIRARLEKELQELLADRKKRPAAPVEKPIEGSR
jgi:hypothetical protein